MKNIDELLNLLVCPVTKAKLEYNPKTKELISKKAKLAFPIIDGIPIMLPSKARIITE
jgi:uncharacterized protein